jgi:hypothetical protein
MKQMKKILGTALLAAGMVGSSAFAADRTENITLDSGTTTLKGDVKGSDSVQYSFSAQPGQQLLIRLNTSNPSNYINVERSGVDEAICQGSMTGNTCSVRSDSAADYVVDVFLMRNAARRGEKAKYTLTIEQDGSHSGSSAVSSKDSKEEATAAVAACKSALALKSGVNSVFVLPLSHVAAAGGYEVFLSLKGAQWFCTTDSRGNVNRMEQR